MYYLKRLAILSLISFILSSASAQVVISEFMAVNSNGIEDEDGDRSDWIELYNAGTASVNLGGWHLTDDATDLTQWEISPIILAPGQSRIIWASNKNRKDPDEELHTNFKLTGDGEYLALVEPDGTTVAFEFGPSYPAQVDDISYGFPMGAAIASTSTVVAANAPVRALVPSDGSYDDTSGNLIPWTLTGFDDSSWTLGNTGIGYERSSGYDAFINLDVEAEMYQQHSTIFARIPFTVPADIAITGAELRMRYDDGFRAYINGQAVAEANIDGNTWDTSANTYTESSDYITFAISSAGDLQAGDNMLAIHGVNDDGTSGGHDSSDFLILPELSLFYTSVASINTGTPKYFALPTPASSNVGGTDNIGPQFSKEKHLPLQPTASEDLAVSVKVVDADGVSSVTMTYEVMFNGEVTVPMTLASNDIYTATIPSSTYADGEMIRYKFNAVDGISNASRWPLFYDPTGSPEFFGTMAQVAVTSSMPVYHWFIEDATNADVRVESRSSIFYNGELYDNIMTRTRGGSTEIPTVPKKSHKFDFNRGHHFEYDGDERKIEEMNLNTVYSDKTYLRRMLSWKSFEEAGQPGCKSFLVHLRRNNAFFGVQNFEEQIDDDFLKRHGFDPEGALYKVEDWGNNVLTKKTRKDDPDTSDIAGLRAGIWSADKESWVFDNLDVANFINYMALSSIIMDGDNFNKNHYWYRDTNGSGDWSIFAWDKDLTFGMHWITGAEIVHDGIQNPGNQIMWPSWDYQFNAINQSPILKALYVRRLRTLIDLLMQTTSTPTNQRYYETTIDQLLATHGSDITLDYNKWGNPWSYGTDYTAAQANAQFTVSQYLNTRRNQFAGNGAIPTAHVASPTITISAVDVTPASGNQMEEYVELSNPNSYAVDISGWSISNAVTHIFRAGSVIPANGKFYVSPDTGAFRSRTTSPKGGEKLFVQGPYKGMLSSYGETLTLHDADGTLKNSETWAENLSYQQRYLRISEVMYHPKLPNGADFTEDQLEFVELKNIGPAPLSAVGTFFSEGLIFTNPDVTIPAGGYLVIASDLEKFAAQYDTNGITVVGPFEGYLGNGSDTIELEDSRGETIHSFKYKDDWYHNTDGNGFSLTLLDPASTNLALWSDKDGWRSSLDLGGSPGTDDSDLVPDTMIINEVLAHSDTGNDWVEIKNMTNIAIDISYWFLSDDWGELDKYQIPNGTTLPANGFVVLHEADFNSGTKAFALSELGDEVILSKALSDGTLQGYQVSRDFDASGKDVSFGRWIDSEGDSQFIPMASQTPGAENGDPRTGPIVISEIMYAPSTNSAYAEYVELFNSSGSTVYLYDTLYPTNGWSLTGAISYTFSTGTTLGAGEHLIICSTNPAAFRTQYSVPAGVDVLGPFDGALNNAGERVRLKYPGNPEPTFVPQIQLESVNYDPILPWPVVTPGTSIERTASTSPANDPASWTASAANGTPGTSTLTTSTPIPVDGVAVSPTTSSVEQGSTIQLIPTVSPANAANISVTWSSLNPSVATVNTSGQVTGNSVGSASIVVTTVDGGFSATNVTTVTPVAVTGIVVMPTGTTIEHDETVQLTATVSPANAENKSVIWTSLHPSIATVGRSGLVTPVAEGTATIRATTDDGGYMDTSSVTVLPAPPEPGNPTLNISIENGEIVINVTNGTANAFFKILTNDDLTDPDGWVITASNLSFDAIGDAIISNSLDSADQVFFKIEEGESTVITPVTGVSVSPATSSIEEGATVQLSAIVTPANADDASITWSSLNPSVATVNSVGLVIGQSAGTASIVVTTVDGGYTSTNTTTVTPVAVTGVSVSPTSDSIDQGSTVQLTATVAPANAANQAVTWSSLNPSVATVNASGLVTGVTIGSATIRVTTADGSFIADCAITVNDPLPTTLTIEAEDFDSTGGTYSGVQTYTVGSVGAINWVQLGDWTQYLNVEVSPGLYQIEYFTGSPMTDPGIDFLIDGVTVAHDSLPINGSWDVFVSSISSTQVAFTAGTHTIRIVAAGTGEWQWNMDRFVLTRVGDL